MGGSIFKDIKLYWVQYQISLGIEFGHDSNSVVWMTIKLVFRIIERGDVRMEKDKDHRPRGRTEGLADLRPRTRREGPTGRWPWGRRERHASHRPWGRGRRCIGGGTSELVARLAAHRGRLVRAEVVLGFQF